MDTKKRTVQTDDQCHAAYPDIRRDWKNIIDRLAKDPVVTSWIPPGMDTYDNVTIESLAEAIHQMLFESETYAQIPFLIHTLAANEDWTLIVKGYNEQQGSDSGNNLILLMQYVINCFEPALGAQPDQVARYSPGSYYLSQGEHILQLQQKICNAQPAPNFSLIYGPGKPALLSALMFNSLADAQNPPSNMDLALKEFTKSRVIIEPTAGHEPSLSNCRWGIVARYIEQGSVDGLDILCMEKQKQSFVIGD